jgi:hypothetical protein
MMGQDATVRHAGVQAPMSDDVEIFRAASTLIEQHGEGAALVASGHAESALQGDDPVAAREW